MKRTKSKKKRAQIRRKITLIRKEKIVCNAGANILLNEAKGPQNKINSLNKQTT